MANRLQIYTNDKLNTQNSHEWIIEANYEIPLFFYPLFVSNARLVASDIFTKAPEGVAFFEQFYNFIELHAHKLIENKKVFKKSRQLIASELEKYAERKWFQIEMSDIFQMSDTPSKVQAEEMLEEIARTNSIIQDAIDANNPLFLDQLIDTRSTGLPNFKAYLNQDWCEYGWGYFQAQYQEKALPEPFEENGKWGVKTDKGKIIVPAEYDDIYAYAENTELCCAQKNSKWLYLNTKGQIAIEGDFDDIYDFSEEYDEKNQTAIAAQKSLYGLINRQGNWLLKPAWDDLKEIHLNSEIYAAKKAEVWGVIEKSGKEILPPSLPYRPRPNSDYDAKYYTCGPEDGEPELYLTKKWKPFSLSKNKTSQSFSGADDLKISLGEGKAALYGLVDQNGETLLQTIYQEIEFEVYLNVYRVKQDKKWGLFHCKSGWLLPCEFDTLTSISGMFGSNGEYRDNQRSQLWIARKGKLYGAYESKRQTWVLDCLHGKILPFAKNVLGVPHIDPPNEAGIWVHNANSGAALAGPYDSLTDCAGSLSFAAVLGFSGAEIFTIGQTGIVKPLTAAQADSLMMMIPSNDLGEFYMTQAQGKLISKYFSTNLKVAHLLEDAFAFEKKDKYKEALDIYLQIITQTDEATKDKASIEKLSNAYVNAGYIYSSQATFKNLELANHYYQKAADLGESQGMNNLAVAYRDGDGVKQSLSRAIELFEQAEKLNNDQAANNLGKIYYADGDLQNHALALKYFLKCYRNYPENLAIAFMYDSFLNDFTSALTYYQKAAKEGSGYAFNRIGLMWEEGLLGNVDLKKAQLHYENAINAIDSDAYAGLNLSKLLVNIDKVAAKKAFQFALDHSDEVEGLTEFGQTQGWL
jgi:uncharacterized protein